MMLSEVWRLSVAYIGPKSRTWRPRKTKIGTAVAHVTHDSNTTVKVKRSKVKVTWGGGIFWRPPAQPVTLLSEIWNVCASTSSHHRSLNECTYLCRRAFTSRSWTSGKTRTLGERKPRPRPLIPPNSYYYVEVVKIPFKIYGSGSWSASAPKLNGFLSHPKELVDNLVISRICWISHTPQWYKFLQKIPSKNL